MVKEIKTVLIDGYLDEPSCLGVPPYISPHIRYTYGALLAAGVGEENIDYLTIDQLRTDWEGHLQQLESVDLVIIIAGTTVPGHYLGGKPISLAEIKRLSGQLYYPQKVLGGPITLIKPQMDDFDHICGEIAALDLYQLLSKEELNYEPHQVSQLIDDWAVRGAAVTLKHPNYPNLVCELETFRGCPRHKHCAFCSERLKKKVYQREPSAVVAEVKALAEAGNHYYRLGCQTDLLLYQSTSDSRGSFIPNPQAVEQLYAGIRSADPELKVLHLDNINPASIVRYPKESRSILETITSYNTPGDIAAFGLESADPLVIKKNNIETDPEITLQAVEIMNEIGGRRVNGIPGLLPGLNFLHGLIGEREETMEFNYQYLQEIFKRGLMLRRINIRQVVRLSSYPELKIDQNRFKAYKEKVNQEINRPMLRRVFPTGTILDNVLVEMSKGKLSYGRQLGSYPILIGIPGQLELNKFTTVRVIDHGYRSVTALPWPFKIKEASPDQLIYFPGIGKKRAEKIFLARPRNLEELRQVLGPEFPLSDWQDWFIF